MLTDEGIKTWEKYRKWLADENFMLSPDFVPDENTPEEAVEFYKEMLIDFVDFDAPDFTWPTGLGVNL